MTLQILLADDHALVRDGMKHFLNELGDDVRIDEAESLDRALTLASGENSYDIVILDYTMPGMNGTSGIKKMADVISKGKIVVLSGLFKRSDVFACIESGAKGFIPKTLSGTSMVNALNLVLSGETYLPSVVLTSDTDDVGNFIPNSPLAELSRREAEILDHLIKGKTNKMIARELGIEEITIKIHLRNVYRKLGASNRADAVRISLQSGWSNTA